MMQIENMDKLADQQRVMAWAALFLPFAIIIFLCSDIVTADKANLVRIWQQPSQQQWEPLLWHSWLPLPTFVERWA